MPISRSQLVKELEPGLNALFGLEYKNHMEQWKDIFDTENSDKAFEEEVMLSGFDLAQVKSEGGSVAFAEAQEVWTARYNHETIALGFMLTEEAIEDNQYDKISARYTKELARSMAYTKNVKGAAVLNNAFNSSYTFGDGVELCSTAHPLLSGGVARNELATAADLSETSLEQALLDIGDFVNERGHKIAVQGKKLIIPSALQFESERILTSTQRVGTANNDINAVKSMGMLPEGYAVNNFLTDPDAWFIKTDAPNGLKHFNRVAIKTGFEGDFNTGNTKYKARERYSFGASDGVRAIFGSPGA